jgi:signal transduction histidine kinase
LSTGSKLWLMAVAAALLALVLAAFLLPQSFRLTAFSDVIQCLLLLSGTASFAPLVLRSQGRLRLFWSCITLGVGCWLSYQLLWTYYEVLLHQDVPDLFAGDVVLFLNVVPLMAALSLRPHTAQDEYAARVGHLDFALLAIWWLYLYIFIVMPWQYAVADLPAYSHNLNSIYLVEKVALLLALVACWISSRAQWRRFYRSLFFAYSVYATSSYLANWAIERNQYYSGSLYDIPLASAMAWLTWIGLRQRSTASETHSGAVSTVYGVWIARSGMIAVFSLPMFAFWSIVDPLVPSHVRFFRLVVTLTAALIMGIMVFVRQYYLDRELIRLLNHSRESFDSLKRLQAQILQSEKLASIGQLVGGAAHELNNPITAMLGYSDLLLSTQLTPEQQPLAAKIGQYVRRTRSLVASLISFARQTPAPKTAVDLNTLARTAIKLTQPQWEALHFEIRTHFDPALPKVLGDSNQLLQVSLQVIATCLHVMDESGAKILSVSTESESGVSVLQIATKSGSSVASRSLPSVTAVDPEDGFGLSACQGILQEHHGYITCQPQEEGGILLRIELPAVESAPAKSQNATVPVLWQSQPYA